MSYNRKINYANKQIKLDTLQALRFTTDRNITSLADVIYYLWFNNNNRDTSRLHKRYKEFVAQITGSSRTREDCYLLAKYYLPSITCKQVYKAVQFLYSKYYTLGHPSLSYGFCYTVQRLVSMASGKTTKENLNSILDKKNLNYRL